MDRVWDIRTQLARQWPVVLVVAVPVLGLVGGLAVIAQLTSIDFEVLTRDPAASLGAPIYLGAISLLGGIMWAMATAVCLFAFLLLRDRPETREDALFMLAAGGITGLLMLDDIYLLHEAFFPFHVGIPEEGVYLGYLVLVVALLVRFRATILRHDCLLLLLAFSAFGSAILVDLADGRVEVPASFIMEDGLKLLGLVIWGAYFTQTALQRVGVVVPVLAPARESAPARVSQFAHTSSETSRKTSRETRIA